MKLSESLALGSSLTDENMTLMKQLGVTHLTVGFTEMGKDEPKGKSPLSGLRTKGYLAAEDLASLKKWVKSHGLELGAVGRTPQPFWEKIILGLPGRDEQIENWIKSLRSVGKVGIPQMQYNMMINAGAWINLWRTSKEKFGRGGTEIVRFDYEVAKKAPLTSYGRVSEDEMWDNFTYFLKATMPVAEESGVTMAVHPFDPQVPSIAGIARIIRSVEAYDRVFKIAPSKANVMNFCLGCFAQMFEQEGVNRAIRHFGRQGRIGYVHVRGVRGKIDKFDEIFPDEGKLDMIKTVKLLKQVGYNGAIQPDHAPHTIVDDEFGRVSHAFQIGYLKGVLQAADALD